jgi:hypothetical protein
MSNLPLILSLRILFMQVMGLITGRPLPLRAVVATHGTSNSTEATGIAVEKMLAAFMSGVSDQDSDPRERDFDDDEHGWAFRAGRDR